MARGLYYCQPHTGVGPFIRTLNISKSLVADFDVDLLLGSPPPPYQFDSPRFHLHRLPALWHNRAAGLLSLEDPDRKNSVKDVFEKRWNFIKSIITQNFAFFIIDAFPFSKWNGKEEIFSIMHIVKMNNPRCLIACSLLDIPSTKQEKMDTVEKIIRKHYDVIFFHADPRYFPLESRFPAFNAFRDKIVYTGFVTDPDPLPPPPPRQKKILVSVGAGYYGLEFLDPLAATSKLMPDFLFQFVLGPRTPQNQRERLENISKNSEAHNITLADFLPNFDQVLQESALSVSLGGGTLYAAIKTRTPAIAYTGAHWEHVMRAGKLAETGAVKPLTKSDFAPERLRTLILEQIDKPYPHIDINLSGSVNTLLELKKCIR